MALPVLDGMVVNLARGFSGDRLSLRSPLARIPAESEKCREYRSGVEPPRLQAQPPQAGAFRHDDPIVAAHFLVPVRAEEETGQRGGAIE